MQRPNSILIQKSEKLLCALLLNVHVFQCMCSEVLPCIDIISSELCMNLSRPGGARAYSEMQMLVIANLIHRLKMTIFSRWCARRGLCCCGGLSRLAIAGWLCSNGERSGLLPLGRHARICAQACRRGRPSLGGTALGATWNVLQGIYLRSPDAQSMSVGQWPVL